MGGLWVSISGIGYNIAIGWGKNLVFKTDDKKYK